MSNITLADLILGGLAILVIISLLLLLAGLLFDLFLHDDMEPRKRLVWLLVIILFPLLGSLGYVYFHGAGIRERNHERRGTT